MLLFLKTLNVLIDNYNYNKKKVVTAGNKYLNNLP